MCESFFQAPRATARYRSFEFQDETHEVAAKANGHARPIRTIAWLGLNMKQRKDIQANCQLPDEKNHRHRDMGADTRRSETDNGYWYAGYIHSPRQDASFSNITDASLGVGVEQVDR